MITTIRRATEADAEALLALRKQLFAETAFMLWEPEEFSSTVEEERRRIVGLNATPNSVYFLAEESARPVALLFAIGGERNRLRHSASLALGVAKSHWRQGIATQLLQESVVWSQQAGLKRLELTVHTTNLRAIAVYLRCGFQVEGVRRASLCVDGRYVDEYVMSIIHGGQPAHMEC